MIKKIRQIWHPRLLRPLIYMIFSRFLISLCLLLLADYLFSGPAGRPLKSTLFVLAGVLYAALAYIAYLRMDGIALPKVMMLRVNPRRKPARSYGDMIDHVDEQPPVSFEELEDDEKDLCILGADLSCFVVFLTISLLM